MASDRTLSSTKLGPHTPVMMRGLVPLALLLVLLGALVTSEENTDPSVDTESKGGPSTDGSAATDAEPMNSDNEAIEDEDEDEDEDNPDGIAVNDVLDTVPRVESKHNFLDFVAETAKTIVSEVTGEHDHGNRTALLDEASAAEEHMAEATDAAPSEVEGEGATDESGPPPGETVDEEAKAEEKKRKEEEQLSESLVGQAFESARDILHTNEETSLEKGSKFNSTVETNKQATLTTVVKVGGDTKTKADSSEAGNNDDANVDSKKEKEGHAEVTRLIDSDDNEYVISTPKDPGRSQEDFRLIVDLVCVVIAATVGGVTSARMGLPAILGYLVSGAVIGPSGLRLIKEYVQVNTIARLGVALLLFGLGVEFSLKKLRAVARIAIGGALVQLGLTVGITAIFAAGLLERPIGESLFLGAFLAMSSTAVVLKCLLERGELESVHGQVTLGMLVVQDLSLGVILAMLPVVNKEPSEIYSAILWEMFMLIVYTMGAFIAGYFLVGRYVRLLDETKSQELFLVGSVALCLGVSLATEYFDLPVEMGAFISGLMVSSNGEHMERILALVEPVRDIFAAMFFTSIGMMINPVFLSVHLMEYLVLVTTVVVVKVGIAFPIVRAFGYPSSVAFTVAISTAQIGEFSFVLISAGQDQGLVRDDEHIYFLGTSALSLLVTPFLLRFIDQQQALPLRNEAVKAPNELMEIGGASYDKTLPQRTLVLWSASGDDANKINRALTQSGYQVKVMKENDASSAKDVSAVLRAVSDVRRERIDSVVTPSHTELARRLHVNGPVDEEL